jgi:hypothetical protein
MGVKLDTRSKCPSILTISANVRQSWESLEIFVNLNNLCQDWRILAQFAKIRRDCQVWPESSRLVDICGNCQDWQTLTGIPSSQVSTSRSPDESLNSHNYRCLPHSWWAKSNIFEWLYLHCA